VHLLWLNLVTNGIQDVPPAFEPSFAAQQVAGVANGVAKGANAFMEGNYAQAFQEFGTTAINGIGLTSSLKQSWKALKAIGAGNFKYFVSCYTGEFNLDTPEGKKRINAFKEDDSICTRLETDPNAPVVVGRVKRLFTSFARIWHLRLGGKVVRTTAEHPFYDRINGWTPAAELRQGDLLCRNLQSVQQTIIRLRARTWRKIFWSWARRRRASATVASRCASQEFF
jgi:hypothetical protein